MHMIGMLDDVGWERAEADAHEIAVIAQPQHETERIGGEIGQMAEQEVAFQAHRLHGHDRTFVTTFTSYLQDRTTRPNWQVSIWRVKRISSLSAAAP